ncbi:CorA metal ion transporter [Malassezia equina]|uniref:CorA metal ion transporter n=1 Tax=Malassezia equina TaxID=1381935 RepID=A0AAF0EG32_9BASI|nr:CorA metal ion transporter [Malassezia equina]
MSAPLPPYRDDPSLELNEEDNDKPWEVHATEEEAQREQDLDAARVMSQARDNSGIWMNDPEDSMPTTDAGSVPISGPSSAMKQRFYQHKTGSATSIDSQSHFIDHRNQSHSLSVNPNSPLAMRAMQGAKSMHDPSVPHGRSGLSKQVSTEPDLAESPASTAENSPRPTAGEPLNDLAQSTHTTSSLRTHLEDDVCFPLPNQTDEPLAETRQTGQKDESQRPGYPFTFDFSILDSFAQEERERQGHTGSWPSMPSFGSPPSQNMRSSQGFGSFPASGTSGDATLYSRRPRRLQTTGGEGGGKYQRKLALFEGGSSLSRSLEANRSLSMGTQGESADDAGRPLLQGTTTLPTYQGMSEGEPPKVLPRANSHPVRGPRANVPIPGAVHDKPYRFTFYSNALPSTIHARYLSELPGPGQSFEDLIRGVPNEEDIKAAKTGQGPALMGGRPLMGHSRHENEPQNNTWWLDVLCPTDQEMKTLARTFGIHPLTTEDILMEETREKIELFRNYYLVCFRSFDQDPYSPTYLEPLNMYILVFREGTLSFHFRQTPHPHNVRRRIKQLKDYINVSSDWISYALIDDITDAFAPLIQSIEFEVDSIDELVLILKEAEQSDMLRRIGTCRKKVMGLLRLMGNKADVVKGLAKRSNEYWSVAPKSDIGMYLSDIQDHLITMTQNLNHYEMILSRSHSNYLAQISIEMTDANNQINDVLTKLTALGTVIVPMNVITGLWGMNVQVPGQNVENLNWFGGICTVMVVIAVSGYITTIRYLSAR